MSAHPVEDTAVTRPLIKVLQAHVDAFARSMAASTRLADLDAARPAAVTWVYLSVLVAWAEDHQLIDPFLRADASERRARYAPPEAGGMLGWLTRAYGALCVHPGTWSLLDPHYAPQLHDQTLTPSGEVCADLVDWWSKDAPSLADEADHGPASISGWLPGDLLQAVSDTRRTGNALVQTPWWVADLIIDRTLVPAAAERRDQTLHTIDPCCGTGHFLARAVDYLYELYTTGQLAPRQATGGQHATGWTPVTPAEAIRRILAGVDGCELDPLTAAVARLRVTVTLGDLLHSAGLLAGGLRLDTIPHWVRPRIVVGDALLAHKVTTQEYAQLRPQQAAIVNLGTPPAAEQATLDLTGA